MSKAGSVAHFEGDIVAQNVRSFLAGEPLSSRFDGHTNCFIESGFGKALLIDYNYQTEPVTGHFPGRVGLPLLKESRLNHLGKLAFQQLYWQACCPDATSPASAQKCHERASTSTRSPAPGERSAHAHQDL